MPCSAQRREFGATLGDQVVLVERASAVAGVVGHGWFDRRLLFVIVIPAKAGTR